MGECYICILEEILFIRLVFVIVGHPNCSHSRVFVLNRTIDSEGRLITKRLHVIYQKLPYYLQRITGNVVTYGGEESIIDPKTKEVIIHTKNLSFTHQASAFDVSRYVVNPDNPEKTDYVKSTTTFGKTHGMINYQIEKWYAYNEGKHFKKGVNVLNDFILGRLEVDFGFDYEDEKEPQTRD